ncbi:MAG TPA: endonuclease MutS2, partial [Acholeplasma sp.]|nr:endonuclease MutS2 [Acholeplasma sp.]
KPLINISNHNKLYNNLNDTFNDYGEIYDTATKDLKDIRIKIRNLDANLTKRMNELLKKYSDYLSEAVVVVRNGRSCLAVKEGFKNKVKGVIHDISASKQTVFIEPEVSLQIMADIELNKILENKEIIKILSNLTNIVNSSYDILLEDFNCLINLDIINAKARYSLKNDYIKPHINNLGKINLIKAKHPLLPKDEVVPIDLSLNKENNTLLITGPNTGGKTVTLKTVGLLTMMIQSGILVPVNIESELAVFNNVFIDIGDEQSIINSLSTFSSHISKIISFIDNLTDNSLVLLDELGSGTDPNEGVALAIAIIEEFQKKDIRLIVTSHFSELKTYAYEKSEISLASVAFDEKTLKPLYYLEHGIIGQSHARLIAERLGMKKSVIEEANFNFMKRETELAKIIDKLSSEKQALNEEKKRLSELELSYQEKLKDLNTTKDRLISEQNDVLKKIRLNEEKKWQEKTKEVNELIKIVEEDELTKKHHIASLKGAINTPLDKKIIKNEEKINVGDHVYISSYSQYGYVLSITNNKYLVKFGIFELEFKKEDIELVKETKKEKPKVVKQKVSKQASHDYDKSANLSVDLRGFRFEEVNEELDKAIDRALLSNIRSLTIIHGFGTGAVKKAVDNYIKKSNLIKSSRLGREGEGLAGVTIITLK